jgi:hypothetical protein
MSTSSLTLEDAIRQSGAGRLLKRFDTPAAAIDHISKKLLEVNAEAKRRLGADAPELTETILLSESGRNSQHVRGFLQALASNSTPAMLLMAWRIIQGMNVKEIQVAYLRKSKFEVTVVLESPYGVSDDPYISSTIHDFTLLRHFGIIEISGRPVFEGFYALRLPDSQE